MIDGNNESIYICLTVRIFNWADISIGLWSVSREMQCDHGIGIRPFDYQYLYREFGEFEKMECTRAILSFKYSRNTFPSEEETKKGTPHCPTHTIGIGFPHFVLYLFCNAVSL